MSKNIHSLQNSTGNRPTEPPRYLHTQLVRDLTDGSVFTQVVDPTTGTPLTREQWMSRSYESRESMPNGEKFPGTSYTTSKCKDIKEEANCNPPSCKWENDIFHICVTLLQCQPKITKTGVLKFWMQHELQVQANMLHNDF